MRRSAGRGVSGGVAQPSLICFTVWAHQEMEKAITREREAWHLKNPKYELLPFTVPSAVKVTEKVRLSGHRNVIAFLRLILMASFQSKAPYACPGVP